MQRQHNKSGLFKSPGKTWRAGDGGGCKFSVEMLEWKENDLTYQNGVG